MPEPMPAPEPTTPPPSPPSGGSGALSDNIGKASTGCGDPMVQEMVAADNRDRGGAGTLQCDDELSQMAMEHSKVQCECAPEPLLIHACMPTAYPDLYTIACSCCSCTLIYCTNRLVCRCNELCNRLQ